MKTEVAQTSIRCSSKIVARNDSVKRPNKKQSWLGIGTVACMAIALSGCVSSMESIVAYRYEHLLPQVDRVNIAIEEAFGLAQIPDVSMSASVDSLTN